MANRQFPRNNNRNHGGRNNNNSRNNNYRDNNIYCPQCNQRIQILDGDIQYSINLHMQMHKPLDSIDQDIDRQLSRAKLGPNVQRKVHSNYFCPECNENIQIYDNDIKRFLELHAQKHKRSGAGIRGDDQSSTSSGRSRNSNRKKNYVNNQPGLTSEGMNALDNIFCKMQPGLKAHRGFVYENEFGEITCGLCVSKIDSLNKISDHLVTKSHEDNTISVIKSKLPDELHDTMDFVSFYGSNLCCNLCRCKIDLSSLNLIETIMNIIAHNAGQPHVSKKKRNEPLDPSKEGTKKLNFLSSKDSLVNSNKHLISCEMQPQFRCKLCDKLITFDQNDQMLLKNFVSHFSSNGHNKCVRATSILTTFKSTYQPKGGKHNLVVTKGSITCTVCNISLEPSVDTLDAHVKDIDNFPNIDWPEDLSARINKLDFKGPQQSYNTKEQRNKNVDDKLSKVNALLRCMPLEYRNVDYIVESSQGQVTCLICNCVIPSTFYNLKTHLTGNSHMKNLSGTSDEPGNASLPNSSNKSPAKSQNFNPFMKENSLPTTNAMNETENGMSEVLDYLKRSDLLIRKNVVLLEKHNDNVYSCKLCKMTLPKSHDMESLKQNLTTHFSGSNHIKLFVNKIESEITKLMTVPLVRANKQHLCKQEDSLICTLCDSALSISIDSEKMKKNLVGHLKGKQHLNKVETLTTNQDATKSTPFLSNSTESLKDQYHLKKASEFADNATKSSNMFQIPVDHFKGPQNVKRSQASTSGSQNTSFLFPNPTFDQFKGPQNVSKSEALTSGSQKLSFLLPNSSFDQFKGPQNVSKSEASTSGSQKPSFLLPNFSFDQFKEPQNVSKSEASTSGSHKSSFLLPNPTEATRANKISNNSIKSSQMSQVPVQQLKELQNFSKSEESTNKPQERPFLLPNPTEPHREHSINVKPKEQNSEPPQPRFPNSVSNDSVMELFHKLPVKFQSDIAFIKKSSVVEGFLACTLCNTNHINPPYLQQHLEEETHVQGRIARRLPSAQADNQNSTTSKKMMQNMKNFFGFSN